MHFEVHFEVYLVMRFMQNVNYSSENAPDHSHLNQQVKKIHHCQSIKSLSKQSGSCYIFADFQVPATWFSPSVICHFFCTRCSLRICNTQQHLPPNPQIFYMIYPMSCVGILLIEMNLMTSNCYLSCD
jgi:hypothetical protein